MTRSTDFPLEAPYQATLGGATDAFVAQMNDAGSTLRYGTYLGGTGEDIGFSVSVDGQGFATVVGGLDGLGGLPDKERALRGIGLRERCGR